MIWLHLSHVCQNRYSVSLITSQGRETGLGSQGDSAPVLTGCFLSACLSVWRICLRPFFSVCPVPSYEPHGCAVLWRRRMSLRCYITNLKHHWAPRPAPVTHLVLTRWHFPKLVCNIWLAFSIPLKSFLFWVNNSCSKICKEFSQDPQTEESFISPSLLVCHCLTAA